MPASKSGSKGSSAGSSAAKPAKDHCLEPQEDVWGHKAITLPKQWPLARPQLATREERLERNELRLGFAWVIQKDQHKHGVPVLPPCSWCGQPTEGYCDFCDQTPATAVCSSCGGTDAKVRVACRRCEFLLDRC